MTNLIVIRCFWFIVGAIAFECVTLYAACACQEYPYIVKLCCGVFFTLSLAIAFASFIAGHKL